ncbi:amino acid adenylation domain-containing protein [Kitasatospora sp. NPDC056651]|uniref:non-ribosomal peptide synthetase n=1 Tax=Kitasatospora sp. NPDC056651 TaxID=3345892 RepID=UPI00367F4F70
MILNSYGPVEPGGAGNVYHEIEGHWDVARLEAALRTVVARHPTLSTTVASDGSRVVRDDVPVHVRVRDLRDLPARTRDQARAAHRERASHRVAPPDRAPSVHVEVSVLADDRMVLHVNHDRSATDAGGAFPFFREWWRAYEGSAESSAAGDAPLEADVAEPDRPRDEATVQRSLAFWRERLDDLAPAPDLPPASDPPAARPRFTRREVRLPAGRWAEFKAHARRLGITPSAALLTAYGQVLAYWGGGERFTIATTVERGPVSPPPTRDAIGGFPELLPVEVAIDPAATFAQRCAPVRQAMRAAAEHGHAFGAALRLAAGPVTGYPPAPYTFTSALGSERSGVDGSAIGLFGREVFSAGQIPRTHLNVLATERAGELLVHVDSVDRLYPEGLAAALVAGLQGLLDQLGDAEGWTRTTHDLRPEEQRRRRAETNDTAAPQPTRMLWEGVVAQAAARPDAPAVITTGGVVSYGELLHRAQGAATWLRERGVGRGDLVGLVMRRGPEQIVGILAALLAGAAYLPVDAGLPDERRAYLLRDGGARCVLTNVPTSATTNASTSVTGTEPDTLLLDMARPVVPVEPVEPPAGAHVDDLAYVLYTSGTTGRPKGVMVSHRNVANVVADCAARFGVDATDRFFGISAFTFDLSVYDVFGGLSAGAAIVLPDADRAADPAHWLDLCAEHRVTVWNSVPAIMAMLREQAEPEPGRLGALRLVMLSGDRIPPDFPAALLRLKPDLEVVSLGGPTETTIWNILHPVDAADDGSRPVPYGRPNRNNTAHVRGPEGWDRPDWVVGEIWAGGTGVARGYHGDPARTAERFADGLYRTGDLGRFLPDGSIEILGRSDFQIKVNGYRIEAGEVETRLTAVPGIRQAVVVRQAGTDGDRLVAHVVPAGADRPGLAELRERLAVHLPGYMIPSVVVWHDALPLTRNGKVDRGRLTTMRHEPRTPATPPAPPAPPAQPAPPVAAESTPPGGPVADGSVETELAGVWSRVLRVPSITPEADLDDFGAGSLTVIRLLSEVRKRFGVTIPVAEVHQVRTVRAMAARVRSGG